MLLAVDVGNTNAVFGLYDGAELLDHWRAATSPSRTADEWQGQIRQFVSWRDLSIEDIDGIVVSSVVPKVTTALRRMCERIDIDPLVVNWQTNTGMPILIDNPSEVGADRLANAVAAYDAVGGAAIVVDLGTATTFDVVSAAGEYAGGVILPGIEISLDALFTHAAALKRIELSPPDNVIGTSTVTAVRSGATYGYAAQVDGLCARIESELGPCTVLSTGGLSSVITPLSERIERHDPWLTLRGLSLIHQRVTNNGSNK